MLLLSCSFILAPTAQAQTAAPATAFPQSGSTVPTEGPPQVGQSQATEAPPQTGLEDIIVTAQQRGENLQKAALPVDAVSGTNLVSTGIRGLDTLGRVVPSIVTLGGASSNTVFIRGVGNFAFLGSADPAVAFNYDGVYIGRSGASFGTFYDLERVEVLTGPQGTLYGRNATGGAINVLPVQPKLGENSGYATAGYGNYNQVDAEGAVNIGLGSNAGLRLSGFYLKRDGYLQDGLQAENSFGGRAQLKVALTPDLTVRIEGDFARQRGDRVAGGSSYLGYYLPNATGYTITPSNLPLDQGIYLPNQQAFRTTNGLAGSLAGRHLDPLAVTPYQDNDIYGIAYHIDYKTSLGTFSLIPAWRHSRRDDISTDTAALVGVTQSANQYSFEARLASNPGKLLDYILGAYYFSEQVDEDQHATTGAQYGENVNRYTTHSPAAYGRLTLHAADWLRFVGGIRYTDDKKTLTGTQAALAVVCIVPAACPTAPLLPYTRTIADQPNAPAVSGGRAIAAPGVIVVRADKALGSSIDESKVTYRGAVEIDLGPRSLLYGSVETGYRSGGFNGNSNYGPENITAWTIGSKNRFFNNRLQFNVELFDWEYRGQQLTYVGVDPSGRIGATTQNIGSSTIRGVEIEAQGRPTPTTTLTVNAQYLDATYDKFSYSSPARPLSGCKVSGAVTFTVDCSGKPALNSPKWTLNLGGDQVFPIGDYQLTVSADTQYRSSRYVNFEYIAPELVGPTWTTNAQISFGPSTGRFLLSVFVRNIEDDRYPIYAGPATGSNLIVAIPSAPRTFGGRVSVRF
ncbi:TonB-dependent receptor [Sphingomonas koreensis]|nr:TonB-dependent receptor [Sphingomonas koreensis]